MRPLPGHHAIAGLAVAVVTHEITCVIADKPEHLITNVIGRWRKQQPLAVTLIISYLALHLLGKVPYDPLTAVTMKKIVVRL